jgi:spore maturation protein CgeB
VSAWLEGNLAALAAADPERAAAVAAAVPLPHALEPTSAGVPTLAIDGLLLHNRRDPEREAMAWAATARQQLEESGAETAAVLGLGLGYHVEALAAGWPGRIVVVEPDDRLLAAAFRGRDLRALLARVELAPEPLAPEAIDGWGTTVIVTHAPSLVRGGAPLRAAKERITARVALRGLRLRILVVSPLGGGSHPLTGYCARALAELGHTVQVLDLAPFAPGMEAIGGFSPKRAARRGVEEAYYRFLGAGVLAAVDAVKPDVLLAMAQAPLAPAVLAEIGRRGVIRALWFVEDHRVFEYWREVIPEYDYFCAIQAEPFLGEAARLCPGQVLYLPCAADPAVHRPLTLSEEERQVLGSPVAFVGAGYRNRRLAFRPLLDLGLRIWGSEWRGAGPLEAVVEREGARIPTEDTVRIFNATDVNLNLHSSPYVDGVDPRGDFVNPRTFEIAAAGAFQVVDQRALLPALFQPGTEVATFTDAAELRGLVQHYLGRPAERAALAAAGRARVLGEHTYHHRMQTLLEAISGRDAERLRATGAREETVGMAARAEGESPLGQMLGRLAPATPFTLDGLVRELQGREGDLSDPEAIFLFLHQFDELYVREHRR